MPRVSNVVYPRDLESEYEFARQRRLLESAKIVSLDNYERYKVGTDWKNAILAILDKYSNVTIYATDGRVYDVSEVPIQQSNVAITSQHVLGSTFNLIGNDDHIFNVGTASVRIANIYFDKIITTRSVVGSATSSAIKFNNVSYFHLKDSTIYNNSKFNRGVEVISGLYGKLVENNILDPVKEAINLVGGAGGGGVVGGRCQDIFIRDNIIAGSNLTAVDPTLAGVIMLEDYCQAIWIQNNEVFNHRGYAIFGRGTSTSAIENSLNIIENINVESNNTNAGVIKLDYFSNTYVHIPWANGKDAVGGVDMPVINLTTHSSYNTVQADNLGVVGIEGIGLYDDGTNNVVTGTFIGYDADAVVAVKIGPNATKGTYKFKATQLKYCIQNGSAVTAAHHIEIDYDAIATNIHTGLTAANNYTVNFTCLSTTPTIFKTAATTLVLNGTLPEYNVNGTTAIDNLTITDNWYGRHTALRLRDNGATVRDASVSGGNLILATTTSYTSNGRGRLEFRTNETNFHEISRVG